MGLGAQSRVGKIALLTISRLIRPKANNGFGIKRETDTMRIYLSLAMPCLSCGAKRREHEEML
jgi:hypothetical protein